ncbi:hypothetical protein IFM89_015287, partial [Coptis chinensis]
MYICAHEICLSFGTWVCWYILFHLVRKILSLDFVAKEMLSLPKSSFVLIGILEALGLASLGCLAGAMLPGPAIPILSQFSRYIDDFLVYCECSGSDEGQLLSNIDIIWPRLMIASSAFQAGASIIKVAITNTLSRHLYNNCFRKTVIHFFFSIEFVFIDAAKRLK